MTWWKAAGSRAARTVAQSALATIGTSAVLMSQVDWAVVVSASLLAGILSLLTSVAGLPEVKEETVVEKKPEMSLSDIVASVGMLSPEGKRVVKEMLEENRNAG